ncbi:antibiotic biosynthesis monooxygenase [Pyrodictium abyssi]|uniref:antibiotic biosynthesis monooxygenase n=1 Tax=Pyrodictium abyssi TaxID=54256 RepID=UPI0030C6BA91
MDGESHVTARIWYGRVPSPQAEAYRGFLIERAVPDYEPVEGNLGVYILERREGDVTHFLVISFWESMDAIKRFAGDDVEAAKYYEEDREFLLEFEPRVQHYTVVWRSWRSPGKAQG